MQSWPDLHYAAHTFEQGRLAGGQRGAGVPLLLADGRPVANLLQVADSPESRVPEAQGQARLACLHILKEPLPSGTATCLIMVCQVLLIPRAYSMCRCAQGNHH